MLKFHITARGRLFKLPGGETIRTPRIFYRSEGSRKELESFLRVQCLYPGKDYTVEEVANSEVPDSLEPIQKYSRIKNESAEISIGGKLNQKR